MAEETKCSHGACKCMAVADLDYCSDYCKDAAEQDIIEIACNCGHGGC